MVNSRAGGLAISVEKALTPVTDDGEVNEGTGFHYGGPNTTIGIAGKLYIITALEYKSGTAVAGTILLSLFQVGADPPTSASLIAQTPTMANGSTATTYKQNVLGSKIILGGSIVKATLQNSSTTQVRKVAVSSVVTAFAQTYGITIANEALFDQADTSHLYLKIYYKEIT